MTCAPNRLTSLRSFRPDFQSKVGRVHITRRLGFELSTVTHALQNLALKIALKANNAFDILRYITPRRVLHVPSCVS